MERSRDAGSYLLGGKMGWLRCVAPGWLYGLVVGVLIEDAGLGRRLDRDGSLVC